MIKAAVIAGTPVDTRMGVEYLEKRSAEYCTPVVMPLYMPAAEIVEKCGVKHMVKYMETCGCEALILGCTHFPYLRRELDKFCSIPVIDPADEMFTAMTGLK